jgi:hypothetical protein
MTGSYQKTCAFGALCIDGGGRRRQFFRQYDSFNQYTFLDYIKHMQNKFSGGKLILFIDRAHQHYRSKIVRKYVEERADVLRVVYFPKGSSEFNAVEDAGDKENMIWYQNTIQDLRISDMP